MVVEQDLWARGVAPTNAARQAADAAVLLAGLRFYLDHARKARRLRRPDAAALPEKIPGWRGCAILNGNWRHVKAPRPCVCGASASAVRRAAGQAMPPNLDRADLYPRLSALAPKVNQLKPPPRMAKGYTLAQAGGSALLLVSMDPEEIVCRRGWRVVAGAMNRRVGQNPRGICPAGIEAGRRRLATEVIRFSEANCWRGLKWKPAVRAAGMDAARWRAGRYPGTPNVCAG